MAVLSKSYQSFQNRCNLHKITQQETLKKMVHDYHEQLNQPAGTALYDLHLHIGHSLPVYTNMI